MKGSIEDPDRYRLSRGAVTFETGVTTPAVTDDRGDGDIDSAQRLFESLTYPQR